MSASRRKARERFLGTQPYSSPSNCSGSLAPERNYDTHSNKIVRSLDERQLSPFYCCGGAEAADVLDELPEIVEVLL